MVFRLLRESAARAASAAAEVVTSRRLLEATQEATEAVYELADSINQWIFEENARRVLEEHIRDHDDCKLNGL